MVLRQQYEQADAPNDFVETTRIVYPLGNSIHFLYDRGNADPGLRGRLIEIRREASPGSSEPPRMTRLEWEPNRALITAVFPPTAFAPGADPTQFVIRYEYGVEGALLRVTLPPAALRDHAGNILGRQQSERTYDYDTRGRLLRLTEASGVVTQIEYGATGPETDLPVTIIFDAGGENQTTRCRYDALGRLVAITQPRGFRILASYNGFQRLTRLRGSDRSELRYQYDAAGRHVATLTRHLRPRNTGDRLAAPGDLRADQAHPWIGKFYRYDSDGRLRELIEELAAGQFASHNFTYDSAGRLIEHLEPEGETTRFQYDDLDRPMAVSRSEGTPEESVHRYEYDPNGNQIAYIDPEGHRVENVFDGFDDRVKCRDPLGTEIVWVRDEIGRVTSFSQRDSSGKLIAERRYNYDEIGRGYHVDRVELDGNGSPTGRVVRTSQIYDARTGRVLSETQGIPEPGETAETLRLDYDRIARLVRQTDVLGNSISYSYDSSSRLSRSVETNLAPAGSAATTLVRVCEFIYDARGRVIQQRRLSGDGQLVAQVDRNYDSLGRLVFEQLEDGHTCSYQYGGLGQLLAIEAHVRLGHQPRGRVVERVRTRYAYNRSLLPTTIIDANGNVTRFRYDSQSRRVRVDHPGGEFIEIVYDRDSKRRTARDSGGTSINFNYDAADRLVGKQIQLGAGVEGVTQVNIEWDALDRVTRVANDHSDVSFTYNSLSHLIASQQNSGVVIMEHDSLGRRVALETPAGRLLYARDEIGRINTIAEAGAGAPLVRYSYLGRIYPARREFGNRTASEFGYDPAGRLETIANLAPDGTPFCTEHFLRDEAGRSASIDWSQPGRTSVQEIYDYDSLARLVRVERRGSSPGLPTITEFDLDALANRRSVTRDGAVTSFIANSNNQYIAIGTDTLTYDQRGNLASDGVRRFAYDYRNRLVRAETPAGVLEFRYDEVDRKVERRFSPASGDPASTVLYLYEGFRRIEERDQSGVTIARYIYGSGLNEVVAIESLGGRLFLHHQHLGSVTHVTNDNGVVVEKYEYEEYGRRLVFDGSGAPQSVSQVGNPIGFTGHWWDEELGLYDMRARHYDPDAGRFTSPDRVAFLDGLNLYQYADSDPVNFFDPFGESATDFLEGLREGFLEKFGGGILAGLSAIFDLISNAGEYWRQVQSLAEKLSDPEVRSELWDEIKAALASILEEEWDLVNQVLEGIKSGASRAIGAALGALLGYLLNKAATGIGGKLAQIFGKITDKVTDFLKRRNSKDRPKSGMGPAWAPGSGAADHSFDRFLPLPEASRGENEDITSGANEHTLHPERWAALRAARERAAELGPDFEVLEHPSPTVGTPHFHVVYRQIDENGVPRPIQRGDHFFYGRPKPRPVPSR